MSAGPTAKEWELRLYIAGKTPRAVKAFRNLHRICEEYLAGSYHIEIIDLLETPTLAKGDQIVAVDGTPTATMMDAQLELLGAMVPGGRAELVVEDETGDRREVETIAMYWLRDGRFTHIRGARFKP